MAKTREEKVVETARRLAEGGWSSIYSFVDKYLEDDDYYGDEDDEDEDEKESDD